MDWGPSVHLGIFVHRVQGLVPGLYVLARDPQKIELLKAQMEKSFLWRKPPGTPEGLELYLLTDGDFRLNATSVSCGQQIAGDGAFSLGMLAEYRQVLTRVGPFAYRWLFWETGIIGQVLYLGAEALGLRSTGIGCFFDDPVHQTFGLQDNTFQSLYHFTVGKPVEDKRLTTLPAYPT